MANGESSRYDYEMYDGMDGYRVVVYRADWNGRRTLHTVIRKEEGFSSVESGALWASIQIRKLENKGDVTVKKITYRKLMRMIDGGDALLCAWERNGNAAIVETYDRQGRAKREIVEITNLPAELKDAEV
jgi:hypothetical protein